MTSKIAAILELLGDGKWHALEEIEREAALDPDRVNRIADFLIKYGFVIVNKEKNGVKLNKTVREFLTHAATA